MANQQLTDFVAKARTEGKTDEQIKAALINAKWPENEINEALSGVPSPSAAPAEPAAPVAGQPAASQSDFFNSLFNFDQKTIETVKWSAIWNVVASIIISVVASVSAYLFIQSALSNFGVFGTMMGAGMARASFINVGGIIRDVVLGAIFGAVGGFILAKFYEPLMNLQAKIIANNLNTLFKLLFWPRLIGAAIGTLLSIGAAGAFLGLAGLAINFVGSVAAYFLYAKMMEKNVGQYYRPF